jgi:hypothetical protein
MTPDKALVVLVVASLGFLVLVRGGFKGITA